MPHQPRVWPRHKKVIPGQPRLEADMVTAPDPLYYLINTRECHHSDYDYAILTLTSPSPPILTVAPRESLPREEAARRQSWVMPWPGP